MHASLIKKTLHREPQAHVRIKRENSPKSFPMTPSVIQNGTSPTRYHTR